MLAVLEAPHAHSLGSWHLCLWWPFLALCTPSCRYCDRCLPGAGENATGACVANLTKWMKKVDPTGIIDHVRILGSQSKPSAPPNTRTSGSDPGSLSHRGIEPAAIPTPTRPVPVAHC